MSPFGTVLSITKKKNRNPNAKMPLVKTLTIEKNKTDGPAKYRSLESYQFDSGRIGCQFLAPSAPNRQRCGI
ncbi:MAG: hypothetical protein DWH73_00410 [Planctomycetota bacterium]|nr:MAG: hypothetical protein DWH73_00410 [Planctomycetota bacterium]